MYGGSVCFIIQCADWQILKYWLTNIEVLIANDFKTSTVVFHIWTNTGQAMNNHCAGLNILSIENHYIMYAPHLVGAVQEFVLPEYRQV